MIKKKMMQTCLSLLLACSLVLCPASGVLAANEPEGQVQETSVESLSEGLEEDLDGSMENEIEANSEDGLVSDNEAGAVDGSVADDASEKEEETNTEIQTNAETKTDAENPEETPYSELLSDENLVLVTVEQNGGPATEETAMETVEELSDTELDALEVYIEEQGYEVTKAAMLAAAPTVEIRTITFNMNGFISLAAEGYGSGYDAMFYVAASNCKGNGNAYCIEPSVQAPGHNSQGVMCSYTTTVRDYTDPMLVKIMYYGFGGVGDITANYATGGPARHILTHMAATRRAAEIGVPGAGNYTYRANQTAIAKANALYAAISAMPDISGRVSILTPVPGQQTIMLLADYYTPPVKEEPVLTELTVKKYVSGTGGNKNTEFHFELIITDPSGKAEKQTFTLQHGQEKTFKDLPVGNTYTVRELDGESLGYTVKSEQASGTLGEKPAEVIFRNSKEMIVPTGVDLNTGTMAGLCLMGTLVLLILFGKKRC